MAAPSMARGYWAGRFITIMGMRVRTTTADIATVVVAPAPVYSYPTYPPVVTPVYPPVVPSPYYYYGGPGVSVGFRGRGVIGVGF